MNYLHTITANVDKIQAFLDALSALGDDIDILKPYMSIELVSELESLVELGRESRNALDELKGQIGSV